VKWEYIELSYDDIDHDGEYDNNEIIICKDIEQWEYRETIIHELMHCILHKYYYTRTSNPLLNSKIEEQLVSILANELNNNLDAVLNQTQKYEFKKMKKSSK